MLCRNRKTIVFESRKVIIPVTSSGGLKNFKALGQVECGIKKILKHFENDTEYKGSQVERSRDRGKGLLEVCFSTGACLEPAERLEETRKNLLKNTIFKLLKNSQLGNVSLAAESRPVWEGSSRSSLLDLEPALSDVEGLEVTGEEQAKTQFASC